MQNNFWKILKISRKTYIVESFSSKFKCQKFLKDTFPGKCFFRTSIEHDYFGYIQQLILLFKMYQFSFSLMWINKNVILKKKLPWLTLQLLCFVFFASLVRIHFLNLLLRWQELELLVPKKKLPGSVKLTWKHINLAKSEVPERLVKKNELKPKAYCLG